MSRAKINRVLYTWTNQRTTFDSTALFCWSISFLVRSNNWLWEGPALEPFLSGSGTTLFRKTCQSETSMVLPEGCMSIRVWGAFDFDKEQMPRGSSVAPDRLQSNAESCHWLYSSEGPTEASFARLSPMHSARCQHTDTELNWNSEVAAWNKKHRNFIQSSQVLWQLLPSVNHGGVDVCHRNRYSPKLIHLYQFAIVFIYLTLILTWARIFRFVKSGRVFSVVELWRKTGDPRTWTN